jgi:hypothetical protein
MLYLFLVWDLIDELEPYGSRIKCMWKYAEEQNLNTPCIGGLHRSRYIIFSILNITLHVRYSATVLIT